MFHSRGLYLNSQPSMSLRVLGVRPYLLPGSCDTEDLGCISRLDLVGLRQAGLKGEDEPFKCSLDAADSVGATKLLEPK